MTIAKCLEKLYIDTLSSIYVYHMEDIRRYVFCEAFTYLILSWHYLWWQEAYSSERQGSLQCWEAVDKKLLLWWQVLFEYLVRREYH